MPNTWDADIELTVDLATKTIRHQFPEFASTPMRLFGAGWDNLAMLVGTDVVFRMPRRKAGAELVDCELLTLPLLRDRLPLAIPDIMYVGQPDGPYPYPFTGHRLVPGLTACVLAWNDEERARCAAPLGEFLSTLHNLSTRNIEDWAPRDRLRKADVSYRTPILRRQISDLKDYFGFSRAEKLQRTIDRLVSGPNRPPFPRWVHGDLYARHLIVDDKLRLTGVIDWGDAHIGDSALDLSIVYSFLPAEAERAFLDAYGKVDDATWNRARFRALSYGAILTDYGLKTKDEAILRAGEYALVRVEAWDKSAS